MPPVFFLKVMNKEDDSNKTRAEQIYAELQSAEKTLPLIWAFVRSVFRRFPFVAWPAVLLAVVVSVVFTYQHFFGMRPENVRLRHENGALAQNLNSSQIENTGLKAELAPFKTAAMVTYGKNDPETLRKLASGIETLGLAYSNALVKVRSLEAQVDHLQGQTERAVRPEKMEELISHLKTLPKAKVRILRYDLTAESERFSKQLETILTRSGFDLTVHPVQVGAFNLMHVVGQRFQVNTTNQPACAKRMFDAFNSAGMGFEPTLFPNLNSDEIEIAIFRLSK